MALTVEPMLNLGGAAVRSLDDDWTVVTADGSLSAQWEHTVVVTHDGHEIMTLPAACLASLAADLRRIDRNVIVIDIRRSRACLEAHQAKLEGGDARDRPGCGG